MKHYPLPGFLILTFLSLNFFQMSGQKKVTESFYNDTIFEFNGCTIGLKNTYLRKNLFLRTTVEITNHSDKFILIDPDDVFISTEPQKEIKSLYKKTVVVPPNYSKKFELKFKQVALGTPQITYNFSKIKFTSHADLLYVMGDVNLEKGYRRTVGNLEIELIDVESLPDVYKVRIRINYESPNFLAINFNNIGLTSPKGQCYNLKKSLGKFHFDPNRKTEVIKLSFSLDCPALGTFGKKLTFNDVFTAYATEVTSGFKMTQRLVLGNPQEHKDKPDIELIE